MTTSAITITAQEDAQLLRVEIPEALAPNEVRGRTLVSLVSPGTELAHNYLGNNAKFPNYPGYAAVFHVEEIGAEVTGVTIGDRLLGAGGHRSIQQHSLDRVVAVPDGLSPEEATLARLMAVTMTTLMTTSARPGDIVLVSGAGPVGHLCAHSFTIAGYDVHLVDPDGARRAMAEQTGIRNVLPGLSAESELRGKVALAIDCSGHEQAILDAARAVRKGGEVVLVGVPWKQRTELSAHELLDVVFRNYVVLRSGWEWSLPMHASEFRDHSIMSGLRLAMRWLGEARVPCRNLIVMHRPEDAQTVYRDLLAGSAGGLFPVFDWRT